MWLIHSRNGRSGQVSARARMPVAFAAVSGCAIAHDFGAISPITR
ncbi:MAG: hypothetical protein K0R81_3428, partial [Microbacterium sp.]|nr:hypothetical protein [Microbacterium sp.]